MRPQHSTRAPADPQKVNVYEPWEELYWGEKLRCTTEQLRAAVDAVGVSVADVKAYLEKAKRSNGAFPVRSTPVSRHQRTNKFVNGTAAPLFQ